MLINSPLLMPLNVWIFHGVAATIAAQMLLTSSTLVQLWVSAVVWMVTHEKSIVQFDSINCHMFSFGILSFFLQYHITRPMKGGPYRKSRANNYF